jgi:hypothetical protein
MPGKPPIRTNDATILTARNENATGNPTNIRTKSGPRIMAII